MLDHWMSDLNEWKNIIKYVKSKNPHPVQLIQLEWLDMEYRKSQGMVRLWE